MALNNSILRVIIVLAMSLAVESNEKDVLKKLTVKFGKIYHKCHGVMKFPPIVLSDFLNYWDGHRIYRYETGCAVICIAYELHLLDPHGNFHIPNARGFLVSGGAEEPMLQSMSDLLRECMLSVIPKKIQDVCVSALEFASCFRTGIQNRKWTPDVSDLTQVETRRTDNPEIVIYEPSANITDNIQVEANSTFDAVSFQELKIYDYLFKDYQTTKHAENHVTAKNKTVLQSISGSKENIKPEIQVENKNKTTLPGKKIHRNGRNDKRDTMNGIEIKNGTK